MRRTTCGYKNAGKQRPVPVQNRSKPRTGPLRLSKERFILLRATHLKQNTVTTGSPGGNWYSTSKNQLISKQAEFKPQIYLFTQRRPFLETTADENGRLSA